MSSQDEFQTWALNEGYIDFRQEAGRYVNPTIRAMWIGWQASRAELVIELPPLVPMPDVEDDDDFEDFERMEEAAWTANGMRNACRTAIEAAGIRTK